MISSFSVAGYISCAILPIADRDFSSRRFSSIASASASFNCRVSPRSVLTSSDVAWRGVSPVTPLLVRRKELFRPAVVHALRTAFFAAQLGNLASPRSPF
jgi:hypothetical protein